MRLKTIALLLIPLITASAALLAVVSLWGKILPNISIASIPVGSLSKQQAKSRLSSSLTPPSLITLVHSQQFEIPTDSINLTYNFQDSVDQAYKIGRSANLISDTLTIISLLTKPQNLPVTLDYDHTALTNHMATIRTQVAVEPVHPKINLINGEVQIINGKNGQDINTNSLIQQIQYNLSNAINNPITIQTTPVKALLTDTEIETLSSNATALLEKSITLKFENETFELDEEDLTSLLNLSSPNLFTDHDKLNSLAQTYAEKLDREPQNPTFVFEDGIVKEFAPSTNGVKVNISKLTTDLANSISFLINTNETTATIQIPAEIIESDLTTQEVNNMGIRELIGVGTSKFRGSIPSRIYNINLAASRLNGQLIAPNETFSFNNALGDVSKFTGYKEAYVIKDGKTILGDGGGVCQVSTTIFRAALNAGLPIVERRSHSYRVGYYEQDSGPGLDATVYAPTTDLKFKNDTPAHILIQAKADTKNLTLTFELYGTKDGRTSQITKPTVTSQTPPPEDLYIDDPTLPTGQVKQIEYKAWGAKTNFDYTVTRDGEIIYEKTFYSNYNPWGAVFLRGTAPVQ